MVIAVRPDEHQDSHHTNADHMLKLLPGRQQHLGPRKGHRRSSRFKVKLLPSAVGDFADEQKGRLQVQDVLEFNRYEANLKTVAVVLQCLVGTLERLWWLQPGSMCPDHLRREKLLRSRGCNFRRESHDHCKDNCETTATALNHNGYGEPTAKQNHVNYKVLSGLPVDRSALRYSRLAKRASGARAGLPRPVLAASPLRTDQSPVPNCPGLRPGLFGTGCWSVCNEFPANADPRPASEARARDRNQQ